MRIVRWSSRNLQSTPDHDRARYIQSRFNSVGNQHVSVADNADEDLDRGEYYINGQTEQGNACAGLQIADRNLGARMEIRSHRVKKHINAVVYETHGNPAEVL